MQDIPFYKYQGTGNDFILIDNREGCLSLSREQVAALCHRRFSIGADGLMLLETAPDADFRMVYYNSDGGESTMCGNGGRCIAAFAKHLGIVTGGCTRFAAIDGYHEARFLDDGTIRLQMQNVSRIQHSNGYSVLDTGSPHFVQWVDQVASVRVVQQGLNIRNETRFAPGGINVNFVQRNSGDVLSVRTYERGVEDETLSCGTGVTAAAIAASGEQTGEFLFQIETPGGRLQVSFVKTAADKAAEVWLTGPAECAFQGSVILPDGAKK